MDGAEKAPLAELRDKCLRAKAVDADKTHKRIRRNRYARTFKDGEGAWNLRARGTVDDGARFMAVFQPLIDEQFKIAKAEGREEPLAAYAFDALIDLAEQAGGAATADAEATPPKRTAAKHLALLRIDVEALIRGAVEGEETCEIAGLGPINVSSG